MVEGKTIELQVEQQRSAWFATDGTLFPHRLGRTAPCYQACGFLPHLGLAAADSIEWMSRAHLVAKHKQSIDIWSSDQKYDLQARRTRGFLPDIRGCRRRVSGVIAYGWI
jgi:hypothetical protein